jgi:lipopolysaccharide biosynthesis glycosyltransferase
MKKLIVTRADDAIKKMTDISHPIIEKFATKWGANFLHLNHMAECDGNGRFHFRIMKCYDLYEEYDRILSLDSDVIIAPNCPNLFEVIPEDCIGTVYEDAGTRADDRRERIRKAQKRFGEIGWKTGYINTGVFMTSKMHRDIFTKINDEYYNDRGFDDVHLGYQINKLGFKVHPLSYKFNHMTMFSEKWNGLPNRFNSNIIHYAGVGVFKNRLGQRNRLAQMEFDKNRLWSEV